AIRPVLQTMRVAGDRCLTPAFAPLRRGRQAPLQRSQPNYPRKTFYRPLSRAVAGSLEITEATEKGLKFHKKLCELGFSRRWERRAVIISLWPYKIWQELFIPNA